MNAVLFSSQSDHWSTPVSVYERLNSEFGFTFDPCPLMAAQDGRRTRWTGRVFCNPPYSAIADFLRRGLYDLAVHNCELLVYLLPARSDTVWFHDYCLHGEIRFIKGRLRFGESKNGAPFPSMIVIFREWLLSVVPIEHKSP